MFGLDIGSQTIKAMQLEAHQKHATVKAYGNVDSTDKIIKDGIITNVNEAAQLVDSLLATGLQGQLTTSRVVMSVPVSRAFTRVLSLPVMSKKELDNAVQLEIEQSVPIDSKNLYFDYETTDTGEADNILVRMVAVPKTIIDSYTALSDMLGLDLALVQTNIRADAQLSMLYEEVTGSNSSPYIIIDVGGNSVDIGILDATLRLTGTVDEGGNNLTEAIARKLHVAPEKAHRIKVSHGLNAGTQQSKIQSAVEPILNKVVAEIKQISRFYEERIHEGAQVSQILIVGGGANMPGLGDYLTNATRVPTRVSAPWGEHITFGSMEPPEHADLPRFLTCAGLALAHEEEALGL